MASAPSAAPSPSRLSLEAGLLEDALRRLDEDHDPRAALVALDRYRARFPDGSLRPEAERARVEALLGLGRRGPALELLDRLPEAELGAGSLRVARGELRAEVGRFAAAIVDFDAALLAHNGPALDERALYGRAVSRARGHDPDGAARDFRDYLGRFPGGRYSGAARRAIGR
jgi:hypothetical protein